MLRYTQKQHQLTRDPSAGTFACQHAQSSVPTSSHETRSCLCNPAAKSGIVVVLARPRQNSVQAPCCHQPCAHTNRR